MFATMRTDVETIPKGTVVEVIALAVGGSARTLVRCPTTGRGVRLPHESCITLHP